MNKKRERAREHGKRNSIVSMETVKSRDINSPETNFDALTPPILLLLLLFSLCDEINVLSLTTETVKKKEVYFPSDFLLPTATLCR